MLELLSYFHKIQNQGTEKSKLEEIFLLEYRD